MQGIRAPQLDYERERLEAELGTGWAEEVLHLDDLVAADDAFFAATGITESAFLEGVRYDREGGVTTHSIVIRALSGSMRFIKGIHQLKVEHIFSAMDTDKAVAIAAN